MSSTLRRTWSVVGVLATAALSLATTASAQGAAASQQKAPPIVGGQPAPIAEHPWVVYLTDGSGNQFCGGTIARPDKIITAAHCVTGDAPKIAEVVAGRDNKQSQDGTVAKVANVWVHPKYQGAENGADVAVVTLDRKLQEKPLALASGQDASLYSPGTPTQVYGWGATQEGGEPSDILRKADVQVFADQDCTKAYQQYKPDAMVCAGVPQGGMDSCQGDSGGPLVAGDKLIGIVSTGNGCARPGYPGIYTRVGAYFDDLQPQLGS